MILQFCNYNRRACVNGYCIKLDGCIRQMKNIFEQVLPSEVDTECLQHLKRSSLWQYFTLKAIDFYCTDFVLRR